MIPYVHMVGMPYSGTTLLGRLLNSHPAITTLGELSTPPAAGRIVREGGEYPCSCGEHIRCCPHFLQLVTRARALGVELDPLDFDARIPRGLLERLRPGRRARVDRVMQRTEVIARALLGVTGKHVFLDTSKDLEPVPHLLAHPGLDVWLLHVVRDPRAVLHSARKRGPRRAAELASQWRRLNQRARRLGAAAGRARYQVLTYESLCERPSVALEQVCAHLGVESVDLLSRVDQVEHHLIGNRGRLRPVGEIEPDVAWREALTAADRRSCVRGGGRLAAEYGYA